MAAKSIRLSAALYLRSRPCESKTRPARRYPIPASCYTTARPLSSPLPRVMTVPSLRCLFLVSCLLFTARMSEAQTGTTPEALLAEGDAAYARFDNPAALDAYRQAHQLAPQSFDVLMRLARTTNDYAQDLLVAGEKDAAEARFDEAVAYAEVLHERYPDRAATYFFLAATYGNLALFKGGKGKVRIGRTVEEYSRKALALDTTYALPYVVLGIFYREVSNLSWFQRTFANALFGGVPDGTKEDAVRMLTHAIALDTTLSVAHYELAMTYAAMGRKDDALPHLRQAAILPPFNTQDRRNQAWAAELLKQWEQ